MPIDIYLPAGMPAERRNSRDTLWLKLTPKKNLGVDVNKRGGAYKGAEVGVNYYFMFPSEFQHNIQHQWEEFDTIAGKARDAKALVKKQLRLAGGAAGAQGKGLTKGGVGSKNDNPVLYMNSTRREFELTFDFSVYRNPKTDVFDPVDDLIKFSLATLPNDREGGGGGIGSALDVDFHEPHTFSAYTVWGGGGGQSPIIQLSDCALINISPSWSGPYIGGYPSKCSLALTLKDLNPTYRKYYSRDVNVNVSVSGGG